MMDVSIVIVNYNSASMIANCITSVQQNISSVSYEIIVVDNNSSITDRENLKAIQGIDYLIFNDSNVGFGTANNIGVKAASGKWLLLLNPDTLVLNDICEEFITARESLPCLHIGITGCNQKNLDMTDNHSAGTFAGHQLNSFLRGEFRQNCTKQLLSLLRRKSTIPRTAMNTNTQIHNIPYEEVDWVNGACLFLATDLFRSIGGFDEHIFLFSEEVDLQKRLHLAGYRQYLVDGPLVVHLHENKRKMSNRTRIYFYEGYFVYARKYNPLPLYTAMKFILFLILCAGSLLDLITKRYSAADNRFMLKTLFFSTQARASTPVIESCSPEKD